MCSHGDKIGRLSAVSFLVHCPPVAATPLLKIPKTGKSPKLLRDPKDHPRLITAQKAKADYLITGDDDLLILKKWRYTKIITIAQCQKLLAI